MKKVVSYLLAIVMILSALVSPGFAITSKAAIAESDGYYIVSTPDEFLEFILMGEESRKAKLANDIIFPDGYENSNALGVEVRASNLVLDGCGFTIKNYNLNYNKLGEKSTRVVFRGLQDSTVKNLTIELTEDTVLNSDLIMLEGGILATNSDRCTFENCILKGKNITVARDKVGVGMVGYSYKGTFTNCKNYVSISTAYSYDKATDTYSDIEESEGVGGICGFSVLTTFNSCENYGSITGFTYTGGISGESSSVYFNNCKNYGTINNLNFYAGGIVGYASDCAINNCDNSGNVNTIRSHETLDVLGGIVGCYQVSKKETDRTCNNCTNTGKIIGKNKGNVGGIVGYVGGNSSAAVIENCSNAGDVSVISEKTYPGLGEGVGGIVGAFAERYQELSASIIQCTNTGNVTAVDYVGGILGSAKNDSAVKAIDGCFNYGTVKATKKGAENVGGIIGNNNPEIGKHITNSDGQHVHKYVLTNTIPATETKEGLNTYTCSCKDTKTEVIPKIVKTEKTEATTPKTKTPSRVVIKSVKNSKKKSVTVKIKKAKYAKKYQVQISTSKKFKKSKKVYLKSKKTSKLTYTFKKLKKGKKYYVRVRAINGTKTGKWSKVKTVKIRK